MKKTLSVLYGLGAYLLFLGAYLYLVAFSLNLAPHSLSSRATATPWRAALIDIGLVTIFGLQHSIMARPGFKRAWTRVVPAHLERSTFVLIATAMVVLIVVAWQPIDGVIWNISSPMGAVIIGISIAGWLSVPGVSLLTDHFALFGLRQVYEHATGRRTSPPEFKERMVYKSVRHPMMLAFIVAMWATPLMTSGHLLFAGLMTSYILIGIHFEERDLAKAHGRDYREYQQRVPKLLPLGTRPPRSAREIAATIRMRSRLTADPLPMVEG